MHLQLSPVNLAPNFSPPRGWGCTTGFAYVARVHGWRFWHGHRSTLPVFMGRDHG